MPVWAAVAVPVVAFVWVAWLIVNWLDGLHHRRHAAESFMEWMNQTREDD